MSTPDALTDLERAFIAGENPAQWVKRHDTLIVTLPPDVWADTCHRYRAVRHGITVWTQAVKISAILDIGDGDLVAVECALPLNDPAAMHLAWSPK